MLEQQHFCHQGGGVYTDGKKDKLRHHQTITQPDNKY